MSVSMDPKEDYDYEHEKLDKAIRALARPPLWLLILFGAAAAVMTLLIIGATPIKEHRPTLAEQGFPTDAETPR